MSFYSKIAVKAFVLIWLFGLLFFVHTNAQIYVSSAVCENKKDPLGIDVNNIRFSWELGAATNNQYQTSYQLVIATSSSNLQGGHYDVWNSGRVRSGVNLLVKYRGKNLRAAQTYYWRVKVWDKTGHLSAWSIIGQFTTGVFTENDWAKAKWIGYEDLADTMRVAPGIHGLETKMINALGAKCLQRPVVPLFRREFDVAKKPASALLFITGLGQYEVSINGKKVGNSFLAPGWTYFDKTVLYNVYDVTSRLVTGKNALGVIIGNGFYNINRERYFKIVMTFGMPEMICCLKILYEDGSVENIISDENWRTCPSPIVFSSIYGGEDYDARLEQRGWKNTEFNDESWKGALPVKSPLGKLVPEQDYPVGIADSFRCTKISNPIQGKYIYDFGQNISGIIRLRIKGKKGQTVKLVPAELLDEKMLVNQRASGEPFNFSYTLSGDGEEQWEPRFSYYGFRFVQVEGAVPYNAESTSGFPVITELMSLHTRNSSALNGTFHCSNELFNRIFTLINWSIKSNFQSVITDCPHREKLSWLEQDYLMGPSIHYNFDIYHLYRKLVADLIDAQYSKGFMPDIAPEYVVFADGFLDSPEWGSSCVILPWLLYSWYGDRDILQRAYPMMKRYVSYLRSRSTDEILSHGLGDWFDYGPRQPGEAQLTPKAVTATSIYYHDVDLLRKVASILNDKQEEVLLKRQALAIKASFNNKFFNSDTKVYATGSQTAMAMPLCVGLVNKNDKKKVLQNLIDSIYAGNKALTAGDIGFHFLVKALDDGGASQLIYEMNDRDDVPGYGFQLKRGATALTESWPALENVSNNHLMLGHIMEWFYSGLAGISQEGNSIAFKHVKIRPQPVGDITSAKASFHSPNGWIRSEWKKEGNKFFLKVHIPVNSVATIYLPGRAKDVYSNGRLLAVSKMRKAGSLSVAEGYTLLDTGSGDYQIEIVVRK